MSQLEDCVPTAYPSSGCCFGSSPEAWQFCSAIDNAAECQLASECGWIETTDMSECDEPEEEGGCYVQDPDYLDSQWVDICKGFQVERYCLNAVDADGVSRCVWTTMPDGYDCSMLWPTPPPEVGCCRGNDPQAAERCLVTETKNLCDRMSICHWVETEDMSDCEWTVTTTDVPYEPGCCSLDDDRLEDDDRGEWQAVCQGFWTQEVCWSKCCESEQQ